MIFDQDSYTTSWEEFRLCFCRFVRSDRRLQLCQQLGQLIEDGRASGIVTRVLVGGSIIRSVAEPNDFDCIVVLQAETTYDSLRPNQLQIADARLARERYKAIFLWRGKESSVGDVY